MRQPAQVLRAVAAVEARFGRLDALVNNAGIAVFKPLLATAFEEWRDVLATNLDGPFLCTQAAAPLMLKHGGGAVVNIASISGLRASTLRVAYGTSKAALIHLTKQQAAELGDIGIRVNCIAPGPVDTAMAKLVHSAAIRRDYHDSIPLGPLRHAGRDCRRHRLPVQRRRQLHQRPVPGRGRRLRCRGHRPAQLARRSRQVLD